MKILWILIFRVIAAHYAEGINLSRCEMGFIALNGGGGSTKDVFERAIQNNEIVFCIVDNDKKHPRAPFGGTCSHFWAHKSLAQVSLRF